MANLTDQVVLITGASSGIGEALAREYVRRGAKVALLARRTDRLEKLCQELDPTGQRALAFTADVTRDGDVEAAVQRTVAALGGLHVVVANAGRGSMGHVTKLSLEHYREQIDLNLFGVIRTVYATLPELQKTRGSIVVVTSVMAYLPLPSASPYNVSKAAAMALSESMRVDLSPLGISVTNVAPGFIDTEIRRVDADGRRDAAGKDPVPMWMQMPAPTAARKIVRAVAARRREVVLTGHGKLGVFMGKHLAGLTSAILSLGARRAGKRIGI